MSVLRQLLFAASNLPHEVPNFWRIVVEFATAGKVQRNSIDSDTAAALIDNVCSFDEHASESDAALVRELISWTPSMTGNSKPLNLILISPINSCVLCGQRLTLRRYQSSSITVYDDNLGPVLGSHFHKICTNKSCKLTQYFGYYTIGSKSIFLWRLEGPHIFRVIFTHSILFVHAQKNRHWNHYWSAKLQIADIFNHVHSIHHDLPG